MWDGEQSSSAAWGTFGLHAGSDWLVWAPFLVWLSDIRKIQRAHAARAVILRAASSAARVIGGRPRNADAGRRANPGGAGGVFVFTVGGRRLGAGPGADNLEG